MEIDVFLMCAYVKLYACEVNSDGYLEIDAEETAPAKLLEVADKFPNMNVKLLENYDLVDFEPHDVYFNTKDGKVWKEKTSDGHIQEVYEGNINMIVKVPSSWKIDAQELIENLTVLLDYFGKYSSIKIVSMKRLGKNTL